MIGFGPPGVVARSTSWIFHVDTADKQMQLKGSAGLEYLPLYAMMFSLSRPGATKSKFQWQAAEKRKAGCCSTFLVFFRRLEGAPNRV